MRLGVIPENPLESIALFSGFIPTPLIMGIWGIGVCKSFIMGYKLGVFESLAEGKKTARQVAEITNCNHEGIETLLNALNGFGFLKRKNGQYSNSKVINRWFIQSSAYSINDVVPFTEDIWNLLDGMEDAIRFGKKSNIHHSGKPPEFWERYMKALATFAKLPGAEIVKRVKLKNEPKKLLDVGGGHGSYSIAFCNRYKELHAEILDLPEAAAVGKRLVEKQGMTDRVNYIDGDFLITEWPEGYDIVLIFNVLHTISAEECRQVINNACKVLNKDGTLIIIDSEHGGNEKNLSTAAGYNELFFYLVSDAKVYPENTIIEWLKSAGFKNNRVRKLYSMPLEAMITGTK